VIRAVLDTNVLVSGLLRRHPDAPSVQILDAWRAGDFELITSREILIELERTLTKPYFRARLSEDQIERALTLFRRRTHVVPITQAVHGVAAHPEDDLILATASSAAATYLVMGDQALLGLAKFQAVQIQSPRDFLDTLRAALP
jgi:putative PIN family toxin of toxin-antitoxin system